VDTSACPERLEYVLDVPRVDADAAVGECDSNQRSLLWPGCCADVEGDRAGFVNLTALVRRFKRIWVSRRPSPCTARGTASSDPHFEAEPLSHGLAKPRQSTGVLDRRMEVGSRGSQP